GGGAPPGAFALRRFRDFRPQPTDVGVRPVIGGEARHVLGAGEAVENLELGGGEGELSVLVLPVEGEQATAEGAQIGGGGRAAPDERGRSPRSRDPPAEHHLAGPGRE